MNIRILTMEILNFKGVRRLNIDFGNVTNITGDNATGKTSIFDALTWLLFGKNSGDAKDFNIKTLDKFNQPIHRLEHSVTATLDVNGREVKLRRVLKEKWTKKKGAAIEEFTGHETEFFIDDVPLQAKEYQGRIDAMMNENIAKMITSPTYFNQLKWPERRGVLEAIAGTISNEEIAGTNIQFRELLSQLKNENLIDFKKRISAKKSLLKKSLETIPIRIEEAGREMPVHDKYDTITERIAAIDVVMEEIEDSIGDKAKAYELEYKKIQGKQQEKHELELKLAQEKQKGSQVKKQKLFEIEGTISSLNIEIKNENTSIERNLSTINNNMQRIDSLVQRNNKLREEWTAENAKTFTMDEHALDCPTCKQALPAGDQDNVREKLATNFNTSKQANLNRNTTEGKNNKHMMDKLIEENSNLMDNNLTHNDNLLELNRKLKSNQEDLEMVKGWPDSTSKEAEALQKQIDEFVIPASPIIDNAHLKEEKQSLQEELNSLNKRLATKEQIERIEKRVEELQQEQLNQSQELADLERTEFAIESFSKTKIEAIEARINGKFKIVKFKMFEQQINGGESECCECMVNGVPYSDVNTAGKIQAGIDIINALTEHYGINAPVWVDNRESIVTLPDCKSQIINLIVKEGAKLTFSFEGSLQEATV